MAHFHIHTSRHVARLLAFALFTIVLCNNSCAQTIFFNRVLPPPGKTFLHVTGMVQDKKGYMWFASKNGLYRYDGYQMIQYRNDPLDPASISSGELETIAIDSTGIIWVGTFATGLERLDPNTGVFTHYKHNPKDPASISSDSIMVICADRQGIIWIGTGKGVDRLDPKTNTFTHYRHDPLDPTSLSSNEVRAIYEDKQGVLWIGTGSVYGIAKTNPSIGGLNRMDKKTGRFTRFKHDPNNPKSLIDNKVRVIYEDSKGNFWVGTAGDGLHTMNRVTGEFTRYPYDPKHPEKLSRSAPDKYEEYDHITFITEDVTGALWIGTSEAGVNYYNPRTQKVKHFELEKDTAGSFRDRTSWWAYTSRDGVLWISSLHGSLYRVNPVQAELPFYTVPSPSVTAIFEERNGSLWLGTRRDGLLEKDKEGKIIRTYSHEPTDTNSICGNDISAITADDEGNIWVGTYGQGISRLNKDNHSFTWYRNNHDDEKTISNNATLCFYNDPGKDLWIGTFYGLNRMDKKTGTFRRYIFFPEDNLDYGSNLVTSILKDRQAKWWAGSWRNGGVQQFDPETGRFKSYMKGASIVSLFEDRSGKLWAASSDGIYHFNREVDSFYRFEDPIFAMASLEVRNIVEDNQGNIWAGTSNGIIRINAERNETSIFGKNYDISGEEFIYLSAVKGPSGKLYFGYHSGYFAFLPNEVSVGMRPPQLTLSTFRLSNKLIEPGTGPLTAPLSDMKEIRLSHDQNIFSFEFVGIDYGNPADNHHLFMLEGYDENWNLAGSERKATYFNVPPGKYVFRVKVVNSFGIWSEKSISIIISPPWWTTWWFRIGVILGIAGIFYLIIRWRVRQKFHRQLEQSEKDKQLAELRQKTGELEMQALRAQMNPHFVFNSLNAINRFILQKEKAQASEYLTKFSRLVRMILQNSQSALITLESELDSLKLYLELEALRFEDRFEYTISIESDIDIDMIKVPPLIIQPYAENAIWHGLMHKEEKGNLTIDIKQQKEQLLIRIKDDGIGRTQSAAMTSKSATKHKSMGLKITADRIAMLQRSSNQESSVIIADLVHPDESAAGTEVLIKIPVIYDKSDTGGR